MSPRDTVLGGGGEMGRLARALDWESTPLGPVATWPQSLRTAASICLKSRFPMLVWWGPHLTQIYNDGYRPILGDKHPRSLGQAGEECWAEIWDVVGPLYERVVETGTPTWSEDLLLVMERAGYREETYFTFSYSPILDEAGGVGGVLVTCVETTERVLTERRMRTLRDIAAVPVAASDRDGACGAVAATLATNPHDVPYALIYLMDAERRAATLAGATGLSDDPPASIPVGAEEAAPEGGPWEIGLAIREREARVVRVPGDFTAPSPLGDSVTEAVVIPFLTPGSGVPTGVLVAGVNPGRALDRDHHTFFRLIAGQIATRVAAADAYEAERERAEELADLDRAKTTFFSNVSHEFRTPLTLLLGPLGEVLEDPSGDLRDATAQKLAMAHRNAIRLLKLVNTLLDFSRLESGRLEPVRRPVDLARSTAVLAGVFRSGMEDAGLDYTVDIDGPHELVSVDPDMWDKIVLNLISNAFKYTLEGGVAVRQRSAGDVVVLEVSDTGMGIEPAEVPHLFERFFRASTPQARSQEGTGIGLAVAKELTELHGGSISVDSRPGEGSTFRVEIPLEPAPAGAVEPALPVEQGRTAVAFASEALSWLGQDAGAASAIRPPAGGAPAPSAADPSAATPDGGSGEGDRPVILVADDNADMREYLRRLLSDRYRVLLASDGEAALKSARESRLDLVLADAMMPRLSGFELLGAIRADQELSALPVILLSARAGELASVQGIEAGADDYLAKPFTARELRARIDTTLTLARARDEARQAERDARKKAEEAVEARARFMANTSHELRTPLNAVLAYLELLLSGASGELTTLQRSHLERVRAGAHHLRQIIEEILTFARLEAGTERGRLRALDPTEPVKEVAGLVRPLIESKGLGFELRLPRSAQPIRTDAAKVRQILLNLLSNAHKYTDTGMVEVRLEQAPDGAVTIDVSDTGPGIPEEVRGRVFEAFWRGPGSDAGGGTGLGLNVARTLARLLGGDITFASSEAGSTFTLALPGGQEGSS